MAFMVWNDKLNFGIEVIDVDHHELIDLLNDVYDGILNSTNRAKLGSYMDRLLHFATAHFANEEHLSARAGFALPAAHRRAHIEFAAWVEDIRWRYENGSAPGASLELLNRLKNWLFDHLLTFDKELAKQLGD